MSGLPFCHVCQKYFNSIEQQSVHEKGAGHLAKVKSLQEQSSSAIETGPTSRSSILSGDAFERAQNANHYPLHSVPSYTGVSQDHSVPSTAAATTFNDLCGTPSRKLQGRSEADQQSIGTPGRILLPDGNRNDYVFDEAIGKGKCLICDVDLTSLSLAQQHLSGKNHDKMKMKMNSQRRFSNSGLMPTNNSASSTSGLLQQFGRNSPVSPAQNLVGNVQDSNSDFIRMCKLCNAPFSCELNMRQHFAGERHRKELRKRGMDPQNSQNTYDHDPDQTMKAEIWSATTTNTGLNYLSPGEKMLTSRIPPEVKSDRIPVQGNPGLDVGRGGNNFTSTSAGIQTALDGNSLNLQRSLSNNLSEFNDKVTPLKVKDKHLLIHEVNADLQQPATPSSSSSMLSSIVDNNQQPSFKASAVSPSPFPVGGETQGVQYHHPVNLNATNENSTQRIPVLPVASTPIQRDSNAIVSENNPTNNSTPIASAQSNRGAEYLFDGVRGHCYVCDVSLTSRKLAQQHLNGQQHRKKSESWEGIQHPLRRELGSPSASTPAAAIPSPRLSPSTPGSQPQDYYHFDGNRGFCRACNSELSSPSQASQHLEGKPHKRNVLRLKAVEQGIRYPLYCEICQNHFTGQESAFQHFSSDKHQHKEALLTGDSKVLEVFEGGKKLLKNGEIWYFCNVCRKALNTFDQLNIHWRSHDLTGLESPRNSPRPASACSSSDAFGNTGAVENSEHNGEDMGRVGQFYAQSRQNSEGSSIDPQVPLAQIQELLTYGENPVVNTDFSSFRNEPPNSLCRTQERALITLPGGVLPEHAEGSRQIKGRGYSVSHASGRDGLVCSLANSNVSLDISVHSSGFQPIRESGTSGYGMGCQIGKGDNTAYPPLRSARESSTNVTTDSSPTENEVDTTSSGEGENNPFFKNVITTRVKPSAGRGCSRDRGHKNIVSLEKSEMDSSDDEDDDEYEGNCGVMNIQGEETQPMNHPCDQLTSSPMALQASRPGIKSKYYCQLCDMQMNAKKSFKEHMDGKTHRWKLSGSKVPCQLLDPIRKSCVFEQDDCQRVYNMTKNMPRRYQVKLMETAMSSDCVVFLPTGTGKTMVSVLTIGLMLEKNPRRPVIFLVDKVLLVIQQAMYIKTEFEGKTFKRASLQRDGSDDGSNAEIVNRELSLAVVCGGLLSSQNLPIWQHDIIVTTVDYCINMLNNGSILWKDFSLAVMDEVHHCVKKHPYRRLIQEYHLNIGSPEERPKILGLTASPAGKSTVEATYKMLTTLLKELGGAKIAFVGEDCQQELKSFQSNPNLQCIYVPLNAKEQHFLVQCINYFLQCYRKLAPLSTTLTNFHGPPCDYFYDVLHQPSQETLQRVTEMLLKDAAPLSEILPFILQAQCVKTASETEKTTYGSLRSHTFEVLLLIADIPTGLDLEEVLKNFKESESNFALSQVKSLGLPCDIFYRQIVSFGQEDGNNETAMIGKFMKILQDPSYIDWKNRQAKALVLVRERKQARLLARNLKHRSFVENNALQVTHLVGHGKGNEAKGMAVKDQKRLLDNQEKYHIIVATSIAEEGVDINTVELVVSMNPPSNVTALVQMRGRARKKGSHFVILCSSEEEVTKLEELRQHESNMMAAANRCHLMNQ